MKKTLSLLLCLCLLCSFALPAAAQESDALSTIRALGIMQGDQNGNLKLENPVSRAEFVTMMTSASKYKDTVSPDGSGFSLFSDVKSTHWASEYVRLAVSEGWMVGYTDGTFRPGETITLEEGCTALLRLLGYDSATLKGTFPQAQLNKAFSIGLREKLTLNRGEKLSRAHCVQLFYNLLTVQNAQGQTYGVTLGYTVTNGQVDYTSVAKENLAGPFVWSETGSLPFAPVTVYRNGEKSENAALKTYDVVYYNEALQTLWVYTEKATGKISAIAPSLTAPTSVTIAGQSYSIGSSAATYALSVLGGGAVGQVVTLLLGMEGTVVDVVTGETVGGTYYGIVQGDEIVLGDSGALEKSVTMICTDGKTRTFSADATFYFTQGELLSFTETASGTRMQRLQGGKLSGKVSFDGSKLGDYAFSEDVEILDTTEAGDALVIKPERLKNVTLRSTDIRYYMLDTEGKISHLILRDATGDIWQYGFLSSVKSTSPQGGGSMVYTYILNGKTVKATPQANYPVSYGGLALCYHADGSIKSMKNTASVTLTSLDATAGSAMNSRYVLADNLQIYLRQNGVYLSVTPADISTATHTLTGYYDSFGCPAGGRLRLIIAEAK